MNSARNKKRPTAAATRSLATTAPARDISNAPIVDTNPQQRLQQGTSAQVNISTRQVAPGRPTTSPIAKASTGAIRLKQVYTKTGSNNLQQQTNTTSLHQSSLPPIIKAPTSLTNLAQLSGITLLPISNATQRTSDLANKPNKTAVSSKNTNFSFQTAPTNFLQRTSGASQTGPKATTARPTGAARGEQSTYNLASIPSIQLLNQTASTPLSQFKNASQTNKSSSNIGWSSQKNVSGNSRRGAKSSQQNNISLNNSTSSNDAQVIPSMADDGLLSVVFTDNLRPTQSGSSFDDNLGHTQTSPLDNIMIDGGQQCVDINGDMNNISLIKLMAILNNPALTITPVNTQNSSSQRPLTPPPTLHGFPVDNYHPQSGSNINFLDSHQLNVNLLQNNCNFQESRLDYLQSDSGPFNRQQRIPQSAANLQLINGDRLSPNSKRNIPCTQPNAAGSSRSMNSIKLTDEFYNLTSPTAASNQGQKQQSDDLEELNWLSNYSYTNELPNAGTSMGTSAPTTSISWISNGSNKGASAQRNECYNSNKQNLHEKLTDPSMLSTSVRNLMMHQMPTGSKQPSVSIQLLKHIDNQAKDNATSWTSNDLPSTSNLVDPIEAGENQEQKSILEPECILNIHSRRVPQLNSTVKHIERIFKAVTSSPLEKRKRHFRTNTNERIWIPTSEEYYCPSPGKQSRNIQIESEDKEVYLSDQHFVLDAMMLPNGESSDRRKRSAMSEPDEIFINRSKRVMSKIDTMVERKKRKRFERISGREASKTNSLEEQCIESDEEWSSEEIMDDVSVEFTRTQLPLYEVETEEKRNHMQSLSLISRYEKNKLIVERCEERSKIYTPLVFEHKTEVSPAIERFVATILKTGGQADAQLRVDSNLKRNDLPLIEGLNRNTSRMKMSYMNILGLEKRSKRTTLYKVKSSNSIENSQNIQALLALNTVTTAPSTLTLAPTNNAKPSTDLNKVRSLPLGGLKSSRHQETNKQFDQPDGACNNNDQHLSIGPSNPINNLPVKLANSFTKNCREVLVRPPNKNEYMKSLGLMAS